MGTWYISRDGFSLNEGGRFACFHLSWRLRFFIYIWFCLFGIEFRWYNLKDGNGIPKGLWWRSPQLD